MKSKMIMLLCVLSISLFSFKSLKQETITAVASYDGYQYNMYSFTIYGDDDDDDDADTVITFSEISEDILKTFDLNSDSLVDQDFEITYEIVLEEDLEDSDNDIDEPTENSYVLKSLKKIKK